MKEQSKNNGKGAFGIGLHRQQGPREDLETGCPKLAIVKFLGVLFFMGDYKKVTFQKILHKNF